MLGLSYCNIRAICKLQRTHASRRTELRMWLMSQALLEEKMRTQEGGRRGGNGRNREGCEKRTREREEIEKRETHHQTLTRARTTYGRKRATCSYSSSHYEKYAATKGWGLKRSGMCGVNWSISLLYELAFSPSSAFSCSEVHNVKLSLRSCIIRVLSL